MLRPSAGDPRGRSHHGGTADALASGSRRRARQAAIGQGGANGPRSRDSRMGEPSRRHGRLRVGGHPARGQPGELKHLSTPGGEINRDRASGGERKRARPKPATAPRLGPLPISVAGTQSRAPRPRPQSENHVRAERHGKAGRSGSPPYAKDEDCGLRSE